MPCSCIEGDSSRATKGNRGEDKYLWELCFREAKITFARSSTVGRSFNNLASNRLGCYSFSKLSEGSKEISAFIDEKKESSEERMGVRREREESAGVERVRFLGAARRVELRDLGVTRVASHRIHRDFIMCFLSKACIPGC